MIPQVPLLCYEDWSDCQTLVNIVLRQIGHAGQRRRSHCRSTTVEYVRSDSRADDRKRKVERLMAQWTSVVREVVSSPSV
jgi:hypothetical protein